MRIRIMFTGRSYQTGSELPSELDVPEGTNISQALQLLDDALPGDEHLPRTCLIAVAGEHIGTIARFTDQTLQDGQELVLIAPVAGG